jgi:uncharacterized damage-inducible protein DinB
VSKIILLLASAALTAFASDSTMTLQALVAKHLATSRDFTVKVAEAMPAADFDFKLTPPQMSFGEQLVHLSQGLGYFLSAFSGEKPVDAKPKSKSKEDVIAFVKTSFDGAIGKVSKLTPEQVAKSYTAEGATAAGADLLLGMLDHTTHHRASAEMYLRAKGITPPEYQF